MKGNRNIGIIIAVAGVILGIVYLFFGGSDKKKHSWVEDYKVKSTEPFGTAYIYKLLELQHPKTIIIDKPLRDVLGDTAKYDTANNYVFIGANMYMNPADSRAILDFVQRGNNAFIASNYVPISVISEIYDDGCDGWDGYTNYNDSVGVLNFYHPALETDSGYRYKCVADGKTVNYEWSCINGSYFCQSSETFTQMGYIGKNYTNFASVPYGKGRFYLYTTPIVFTNYFMRDSNALEYADKVFSHLNNGPVIWDEYSKLLKFSNNSKDNDNGTPLSYILSQPGLRYAWYLIILGAILYIVFMARRRQRVTDVVELNTNTSLSYINTISSLYFTNANHVGIAHHKMKYFNAFVRNKYNITLHADNEEQIISLSKKSQVPVTDIHKILNLYNRIAMSYDIGEESLIDLHNAIENFYTNCK